MNETQWTHTPVGPDKVVHTASCTPANAPGNCPALPPGWVRTSATYTVSRDGRTCAAVLVDDRFDSIPDEPAVVFGG